MKRRGGVTVRGKAGGGEGGTGGRAREPGTAWGLGGGGGEGARGGGRVESGVWKGGGGG